MPAWRNFYRKRKMPKNAIFGDISRAIEVPGGVTILAAFVQEDIRRAWWFGTAEDGRPVLNYGAFGTRPLRSYVSARGRAGEIGYCYMNRQIPIECLMIVDQHLETNYATEGGMM